MGCRVSFVGLTGLAGSGKDLFFSLSRDILKKKRKAACRVSLADTLKEQTRSTLKSMFNIDPTNCSREEKDKVRDFLVFYGALKRKETKGRYWINKAKKTITAIKQNLLVEHVKSAVIFITDIRYDHYAEDERHWIQEELSGKLIHISKYKRELTLDESLNLKEAKAHDLPPNPQEARFDPLLSEAADVNLIWGEEDSPENPELIKVVDSTLKKIGVI
jgi:hypothetical protein